MWGRIKGCTCHMLVPAPVRMHGALCVKKKKRKLCSIHIQISSGNENSSYALFLWPILVAVGSERKLTVDDFTFNNLRSMHCAWTWNYRAVYSSVSHLTGWSTRLRTSLEDLGSVLCYLHWFSFASNCWRCYCVVTRLLHIGLLAVITALNHEVINPAFFIFTTMKMECAHKKQVLYDLVLDPHYCLRHIPCFGLNNWWKK